MKKFFVALCLILAGTFFSVDSQNYCGFSPAFAETKTYTEAQIMNILRNQIDQGGISKSWSHRDTDWIFSGARECYKAPSGIIYAISQKRARNLSEVYLITQVDLNSNKIRWIEAYILTNPMYGSLQKLNDFYKEWRSEEIITLYCNYLRENYNEINGVEK